jgi:hypothetical protein
MFHSLSSLLAAIWTFAEIINQGEECEMRNSVDFRSDSPSPAIPRPALLS